MSSKFIRVIEYKKIVNDLLSKEEIKKLNNYQHHMNQTRLGHSIKVSYYSYFVCKKFKWDYKSAARSGLLHDAFHYEWRESSTLKQHILNHPLHALESASKLTNLNEVEKNAIVSHMWPLAKRPKYKEAYIVTIVDKYSTATDLINSRKSYRLPLFKFCYVKLK